MMTEQPARATRYRGAQPFGDDAVSRHTYFGRRESADALAAQIQAGRLVVVYGRSGLGKSSLLNAAVAPLLREVGLLPLMLRLNDIQQPLAQQLMRAVQSEAGRQGIETVPGETTSLWRYFQTLELWQGDLLATPVLVIDQFEEVFTLHSETKREAFLDEFGPLARGVAPPAENEPGVPPLHIVLSLREDFLGLLEDASDRIPQILDRRFRLRPLDRRAATEAMVAPAALTDPTLTTPPFQIAPAFVETVLDYLTSRSDGATTLMSAPQVDPFHLQLICQRVEDLVSGQRVERQAPLLAPGEPFNLVHFGGRPALAVTMRRFYADAIDTLIGRGQRRGARKLCQDYLISPEGRRLSIEAHEITRMLGLTPESLQQLVGRRLLRAERRSSSVYFELGHDAMVEPILATRRVQRQLVGWALTISGALLAFIFGLFTLMSVAASAWMAVEGRSYLSADIPVAAQAVLFLVGMAVYSAITYGAMKMFLAGRQHLRRYRKRDKVPALPP